MNYRFAKSQHLRTQAEFDRVYASEAYAADDVLVVKGAANETGITRLGLSVSRKVGNAVTRNRWKRLIREAFRLAQHDLPRGLDLVVRPKAGAEPDFERIRGSLPVLVKRVARKLLPH
jgi:ribonuclease P protein component